MHHVVNNIGKVFLSMTVVETSVLITILKCTIKHAYHQSDISDRSQRTWIWYVIAFMYISSFWYQLIYNMAVAFVSFHSYYHDQSTIPLYEPLFLLSHRKQH